MNLLSGLVVRVSALRLAGHTKDWNTVPYCLALSIKGWIGAQKQEIGSCPFGAHCSARLTYNEYKAYVPQSYIKRY